MMVEVTIDGKKVKVEEGSTVLEAARKLGIAIPALCCHPGLEAFGGCRLCLVEVLAGGKPGLAASCALPVAGGLSVGTDTERVLRARRVVAGLLLARCPDSPAVRELAERLEARPFRSGGQTSDCALCGLCVRACRAAGKRVIDFSRRGARRTVGPPFGKPSPACLACRACEQVCPLGRIKVTEEEGRIRINPWLSEQEIQNCERCGRPLGARNYVQDIKSKAGEVNGLHLCPACRRRELACYCGFK